MNTGSTIALEYANVDNQSAIDCRLPDPDLDAGLNKSDIETFRNAQISVVRRNTPFVMAGNILASLVLAIAAWGSDAGFHITLWSALISTVSIYHIMRWFQQRHVKQFSNTDRVMQRALRSAFGMGLVWALLPALFFNSTEGEIQTLIAAATVAAIGAGTFSLARILSASIIFTSLVSGALISACLVTGTVAAVMLAIVITLYASALISMVYLMHLTSLARNIDKIRLSRQNEIITLLLKDFEAGTSDWLWETGRDGRLSYVPDRLCQILERDRGRLLGAKLHQAAGMSDTDPGWCELEEHFRSGTGFKDIEVQFSVAGRQIWWQLSARPLLDDNGRCKGFRGVCSDITARKKAVLDIARARDEAQAASEAKSRFLSVMSHELRSPLNAISGFADLIADEREGPVNHSNYVEYAKNIQLSSRHLGVLINDILDITRIDTGKLTLVEQEIDPGELFSITARMCKAEASDGSAEIVEKFSPGDVLINGDLTRLKQILLNIIGNAVKFTPEDGKIELDIRRDKKGGIRFIVSDNGPGINKEHLAGIFEPFMQGDQNATRRHDGIGLGLAIASRLAQLHDGQLNVESKPGKGTTMILSLPASRVVNKRPVKAA